MCRSQRIRTMRQFFEQEIRLPDGPDKGQRFRTSRQPFSALLLDAIDAGQYPITAITGPSQTGKSLLGYVGPSMYHLFELGQTGVCGVTDMGMAADKWQEDFLPAIEASKYKEMLPRSGPGSRGGKYLEAVKFRNGATLKFMSSAGDDKKRSHFTANFLAITEVDGMDEASTGSREADPVEQMLARTRAYENHRVYMECTVSIENGRIWQQYKGGTASRIALPCPHCGAWVTPEREDLVGWQDAEDEIGAQEEAAIACPECRGPWSEPERQQANRRGLLVHQGQEITPEGLVVGSAPRTRTLGFRWNAANNLLRTIGSTAGVDEWNARKAVDNELAEKKLKQFVWAVPVEPDDTEVMNLSVKGVTERMGTTEAGVVPTWSDVITLGVDAGQHLMHWVLLAGDLQQQRHVQIVDYGVHEVHSRQYRVEEALGIAIDELGDRADNQGWPDENGEQRLPDLVWWDAGWKPVPFYRHCKNNPRHWSAKGQGLGQYGGAKYHQPKTTGATVLGIYDGFHLVKIKHSEFGSAHLYECDADQGKARCQNRLGIPMDEPGAILLPKVANAAEHTSFAKHSLSEQLMEIDGVQKFAPTPGHGRKNHWLDAMALAMMAMMRRWSQPKSKRRRSTGGWAR